MKNTINILSHDDYNKIINGETKAPLEFLINKNSLEFNSFEEMIEKFKKIQGDSFIAQMKIINILTREQYNKLCQFDPGSINGATYKIVTQIGNYRFTETYNMVNGILKRRYFILDFNNTVDVDGVESCKEAYELHPLSFLTLISEICSFKQAIEDDFRVELAKDCIDNSIKLVERLIESYLDKKILKDKLKNNK